MIITRSYANKLVRAGKAVLDGATTTNGQRYQIVDRLDIQRVDHYPLHSGQPTKIAVQNSAYDESAQRAGY